MVIAYLSRWIKAGKGRSLVVKGNHWGLQRVEHAQPDERKEPCTVRNIIYESECSQFNQLGERKENDKNGLEERHCKPVCRRVSKICASCALDHWRDAESGKEETHMVEHQAEAHRGKDTPQFRFRVVKKCKSSLERQVREAVRIQMRGNVLNKKGVYNRCKLTRLVIDSEWEEQTWRESWEPTEMEDVNKECIGESSKAKRKDPGRGEKC